MSNTILKKINMNKYTTIKNLKIYDIFTVVGIELEFVVVDKKDFTIKNIVRKVLKENQINLNEYIELSNEMVNHVIELKLKTPINDLKKAEYYFQDAYLTINKILEKYNAVIIPLSMHPFMKPVDSEIWKGEGRGVYNTYDKLFGFNTHSFSNMQSLQITLPFNTKEEMVKLHNSIRLVLPFLKTLSSSSPFIEGKNNGIESNRIYFFENSQSKLLNKLSSPITEYLNSELDYIEYMENLYQICKSFNVKNIKPQWFNSQGSMIKYNLNAIEIRVCDIQESMYMNMALSEFIYKFVKYIYENIDNLYIDTNFLLDMFHKDIVVKPFLKIFNLDEEKILSQKDFIYSMITKLDIDIQYLEGINILINKNLSQRIIEKYKEYDNSVLSDIITSNIENNYFI